MKYNLLIPMAGAGRRFVEAGYTDPKPFIPIGPIPMIAHAMQNLFCSTGGHYVNKVVWIHSPEAQAQAEYWSKAYNAKLVPVLGLTQGAACSALLAAWHIDNDEPLVIANSDQWIDPRVMPAFLSRMEEQGLAGGMLTFPSLDPKWSYARLNQWGRVAEVAEKQPISTHATVGVYFFQRGSDFVDAATEMILRDARFRGEFYIAPAYNELILQGRAVGIHEIEERQMRGLGTPEDLEAFKRENGYV